MKKPDRIHAAVNASAERKLLKLCGEFIAGTNRAETNMMTTFGELNRLFVQSFADQAEKFIQQKREAS